MATPFSPVLPPNMFEVGPGGFTSIQAAVNAAFLSAETNKIIKVAPGFYPAFTITDPATNTHQFYRFSAP